MKVLEKAREDKPLGTCLRHIDKMLSIMKRRYRDTNTPLPEGPFFSGEVPEKSVVSYEFRTPNLLDSISILI